jgi:putative sigma-54 modulation protein
MQITVSGHHVDITEAIRNYVISKLSKLERRYEKITSTSVILTVEKLRQKVEATVHVSGGEIFAVAEHTDMYTAIDALSDKLDRQIIKHKEKHRGH